MRTSRGEGYVVVQAVLILAVAVAPLVGPRPAAYPASLVILGGLLGALGLTVAVLGSIALGRSLSPFPKPLPDARLVEHGVYAVVRHPIYSGITLLAVGWSLLWGSVTALLAALVLLVFFDLKARREERWLADRYAGYADYRRRVRKLIPFVY